jgi:exodeoxyribonuclease V alpha subunit
MSTLQRWLKRDSIRLVDIALAEAALHIDSELSDAFVCALALCSRASAEGHSAIPLTELENYLASISSTLTQSDWDCLAQIRHLPDHAYVQRDGEHKPHALLCIEHDSLALPAYANAEQALAQHIQARSQRRFDVDTKQQESALKLLTNTSDDQANHQTLHHICRASAEQGLLLLTGGPGTGKTYSIAAIIAFHLLQNPTARIALAAPTGKAAARLNAALQEFRAQLIAKHPLPNDALKNVPEVQTVHRLLGIRESSYKTRTSLDYDLIIIDEASMLDLPRMLALFQALPQTCRLVLVGDPDQLPSVEAGQVMRAICEVSDQKPGTLSRIDLRTVHRQQTGSAIIALAQAIKHGDADAAIAVLSDDNAALTWHSQTNSETLSTVLHQASQAFAQIHSIENPEQRLQAGQRFRLLCAEHGGRFGTRAINQWMAQQFGHESNEWFAGRWCLVERNDYQQQLFNGDLGLCVQEASGLSVHFADAQDVRRFNPFLLGELSAAFAISVHKAQGSEFDQVSLLLPAREGIFVSREWLYTAVTRARQQLKIIASESDLRAAINQPTQRWSSLTQRLLHKFEREG